MPTPRSLRRSLNDAGVSRASRAVALAAVGTRGDRTRAGGHALLRRVRVGNVRRLVDDQDRSGRRRRCADAPPCTAARRRRSSPSRPPPARSPTRARDLTGDQTDLTATGAFQVTAEGASNANVPDLPVARRDRRARGEPLPSERERQPPVGQGRKRERRAHDRPPSAQHVGRARAPHDRRRRSEHRLGDAERRVHLLDERRDALVAHPHRADRQRHGRAGLRDPRRRRQARQRGGRGGDTTAPEHHDHELPGQPDDEHGAPPSPSPRTSRATFECSLDGSAFAACSSPMQYTGLANTVAHLRRTGDRYRGQHGAPAAEYVWAVNAPDTTPPDDHDHERADRRQHRADRQRVVHLQRERAEHLPVQPRWCGLLDLLVADLVLRAHQREPHLHGEGHRHGGQRRVDARRAGRGPSRSRPTRRRPTRRSRPSRPTPSTNASATFAFSSSKPNSTFACDLDGAGYRAVHDSQDVHGRERLATRSASGRPTRSRRPTPIPRRRPSPGQ